MLIKTWFNFEMSYFACNNFHIQIFFSTILIHMWVYSECSNVFHVIKCNIKLLDYTKTMFKYLPQIFISMSKIHDFRSKQSFFLPSPFLRLISFHVWNETHENWSFIFLCWHFYLIQKYCTDFVKNCLTIPFNL
jgi:hypothetical protein